MAERPIVSQVKIGQYVLKETLGSGTFGKVKVGVHQSTGHKVAIKVINRDKIRNMNVVGKIRREIQNLKLFRHPHIIKLYQVISTPTDIFMIMEYVQGGELFGYIVKNKRLQEAEARKFFQQVISGIDYCHRHMVVHRDLKPENILLDKYKNVKICDFGLSNMMTDGEFLRTSCGSPNYAAPEVIAGRMYAGPEVDVWSCGVVLYTLLCGMLPFDDADVNSLFRKIKTGIFLVPDYVPPAPSNLIKKMLQLDPIKRATIKDIKEHDWFKVDLPEYLFPSASDVDASVVDTDAIREVCQKCQVLDQDVHHALLSGDPQDQLVIAYNLIVDNKRISDETDSKIRIKDFFFAGDIMKSSEQSKPHPERMPEIHTTPALEPIMLLDRKNPPLKKAKWHLGIRSQSRPHDIMQEVYRALKSLNFEWKIVNNFSLRVRRQGSTPGDFIKIGLQLYQVDSKNFLLDFKNLNTTDHPDAAKVKRMTARSQIEDSVTASDQSSVPSLGTSLGEKEMNLMANIDFSMSNRPYRILEFFETCCSIISVLAQ